MSRNRRSALSLGNPRSCRGRRERQRGERVNREKSLRGHLLLRLLPLLTGSGEHGGESARFILRRRTGKDDLHRLL